MAIEMVSSITKLSAAIRKGSQGLRQLTGKMYEFDQEYYRAWDGVSQALPEPQSVTGVCALGAVIAGVVADPLAAFYDMPDEALIALLEPLGVGRQYWLGDCPGRDDEPCYFDIQGRMRLDAVIIHLNDEHQWTFEQIASWLESVGE